MKDTVTFKEKLGSIEIDIEAKPGVYGDNYLKIPII